MTQYQLPKLCKDLTLKLEVIVWKRHREGTEENIGTQESGSNRRTEKTT